MPRSDRSVNIERLEHPELWESYWMVKTVDARNDLVEALLPWGIHVARKIVKSALGGRCVTTRPGGSGLTPDERAVIAVALIRVVEAYDPSKSALGTYLWCCVRGAVVDLWRRQGWFPKRWYEKAAVEARGGVVKMASLDKMRDDHCDDEGADLHPDHWMPGALVDQDGMREVKDAISTHDQCLRWLRSLSGQDALVIRRHYMDDVSFKDIARDMGVSRQRVSTVHRRALVRIKKIVGEQK